MIAHRALRAAHLPSNAGIFREGWFAQARLAYDTKHGKRTYIHTQNHLVRGDETAGGHACALLAGGQRHRAVGRSRCGQETQFVQGVAAGLGVRDQVTSPFNILLTYPAGSLPLYHFDLYRLERGGRARGHRLLRDHRRRRRVVRRVG